MSVYDLIENPPQNATATARLWSWSENYDYPSPATLFLDLIGYSEEELGERLCVNKFPSLGYLELGMLGEAVVEYSNHPQEVMDFVKCLVEQEVEE